MHRSRGDGYKYAMPPIRLLCNPADQDEMAEAAYLLDLELEITDEMPPGLVKLTSHRSDPTVVPTSAFN